MYCVVLCCVVLCCVVLCCVVFCCVVLCCVVLCCVVLCCIFLFSCVLCVISTRYSVSLFDFFRSIVLHVDSAALYRDLRLLIESASNIFWFKHFLSDLSDTSVYTHY